MDPGDAKALSSANGRERASNKNLAVRLNSNCVHGTIRVRVETAVQGSIGINPRDVIPRRTPNGCKGPSDHDLAIRLLNGNCVDGAVRARIEAVQTVIGIEPRYPVASRAAHVRPEACSQ